MAPPDASTGAATERLGRYEILGEIASGGMATVFLARVTGAKGFQRLVAIKRLHPHLASEEDFVAMFLDEARLAARIRHQNVVATLDVEDQNGLYLVMEYIEGDRLLGLLRHAAKTAERIPPTIALRIALDTLAGLHAAHELTDDDGAHLGLVHRDVSPQNILVGVDGVARLTDFGIAKATSRLTVTRDGQLKGKIAYMAPEQTRRAEIDRRVDVFAMGIITWEMLTAKKLFTGESDVEVLNQLLFEPIPRVKDHAPGLPAGLDLAVMKALERDPAKRYMSASEFADALERASKVFGGPANTRTVAAYVQKVAGDKLARDRARINGVASAPSGSQKALSRETPGFGLTPSGVQRKPPPPPADPPHETLASSEPDAPRPSLPPPLPTAPPSRPSTSGRPGVPGVPPRGGVLGAAVRPRSPTLQGVAVPQIPGVTTPAVRPVAPPPAPPPAAPPMGSVDLLDDDEDVPTQAFGKATIAPTLAAMGTSSNASSASSATPAPSDSPSLPADDLAIEDGEIESPPMLTGPAVPPPPVPPRASSEPAVPAPSASPDLGLFAPPPPVTAPATSVTDLPDVDSVDFHAGKRRALWITVGVVSVLGIAGGVAWRFQSHHAPPAPVHRAASHADEHANAAPTPPPAPPTTAESPTPAIAATADAAVAAALPASSDAGAATSPDASATATALAAESPDAAVRPPSVAAAPAAESPTPSAEVHAEPTAAAAATTTAAAVRGRHHPVTTVTPPAGSTDATTTVVHPHATGAVTHPAGSTGSHTDHPPADDDPFGSSNPYSH